MAYLRVALRKNWFINTLVEHLKKNNENARSIDFQFHNHKFSQKDILDFHVTTGTDKCMNEVIESSLRKEFWRKIMETLKALILTINLLNLVSKGLSFYYAVTMQFIVPFIENSSRPEVFLKISQN